MTPRRRCRTPMTWDQRRRQFGRLMRRGLSTEKAKRIMPPLCQKCLTVTLDERLRFRNWIAQASVTDGDLIADIQGDRHLPDLRDFGSAQFCVSFRSQGDPRVVGATKGVCRRYIDWVASEAEFRDWLEEQVRRHRHEMSFSAAIDAIVGHILGDLDSGVPNVCLGPVVWRPLDQDRHWYFMVGSSGAEGFRVNQGRRY